ncbi:MAG TPA: Hsp20/alpha crystallin family protein [Bacteroidota bacterium]|nr:Hsp20/alpha crystallin family protein [Bacteroidota bacterium]
MTKEVQKTNGNEVAAESAQSVWVIRPAVEIQELPDSYVVRLDIPGADKESITARINQATLTVSAKVSDVFERGASQLSGDSRPAEYRREFSLAENVDTGTVDALYDLGVLKVTLRKKQRFLPREIKIG